MTAMLWVLGALFVFWHGYVHAMGLYRARLQGRLVGLPLLLSLPVLSVTFALDVILQFTVAALVFWRWPSHEIGELRFAPITNKICFYQYN
jgi:uncharacterized membrane protein YecN with MAPEG domain